MTNFEIENSVIEIKLARAFAEGEAVQCLRISKTLKFVEKMGRVAKGISYAS